MTTIAENITEIKKAITAFEQKYGRKNGSVKLLAVSKKQSVEKIREAFHAGQQAFGENYLQEALLKINALPDMNIEWHFIGPIQRNKTRKIAEHFSWVQSVDDMNIAKRLNEQRPLDLPPLNICIQVNIDNEPTKSGVLIDDVLPLMQYCSTLPQLRLRGLMAIPEEQIEFLSQRKAFHKLFLLQQTLCKQGFELDTLSMGMSSDFEAAIAEGSTLIRLGTAIFGSRT